MLEIDKIYKYKMLKLVKKRLDELNVPYSYVDYSPRDDKKIVVIIDGKPIHFGQKSSTTYLEGASELKRKNYRARASKIIDKRGRYTYKVKYTPNYLAYNILW